jgi:hypothetical protein
MPFRHSWNRGVAQTRCTAFIARGNCEGGLDRDEDVVRLDHGLRPAWRAARDPVFARNG